MAKQTTSRGGGAAPGRPDDRAGARPEARATTTLTPGAAAAALGGIDPLMELKPGAEDVRRRAYERFLARQAGGLPGGPDDDWFQAERELNGRTG